MNAMTKFDAGKLSLIRRTVAKDCTDDEFRLFVHMCDAVRLDPLRKQAMAFVFNKNDKDKRQLTLVTSIGGYRAIADRTGNYRPDSEAPRYTKCAANEKTNPLGIESCEVTVFKHSHGEWFPVVGQAFWDEYVPLYSGEIDKKKQGWLKMPRIMIAKCAEANALRKAWPDDFANIHAEEETDREDTMDAVAAIEKAEQIARLEKVGGTDSYIIDWMDGNELCNVSAGQFGDQILAFLKTCEGEPMTVKAWRERNRVSFNQFWARHKGEALELKKALEKAEAIELVNAEDTQDPASKKGK